MRSWQLSLVILLAICAGCGTTRWSDTQRTATEQLLVSDAVDRAVNRLDFRILAGRTVYLDASAVKGSTDSAYLVSTLRQQLLAQGCFLRDKREQADYIVEARAGAVGTDRQDVFCGVPATNVPAINPAAPVPAVIPEITLVKKTEQRAVAKIALFAYNRRTGCPIWQSGTIPVESKVKDLWVLGTGPYQHGGLAQQSSRPERPAGSSGAT